MARKKTQKEPVEIEPIKPDLDDVAEHIITLSLAMEGIEKSRLKKQAVLILLKAMTGISMGTIDTVLKALSKLKEEYVK